MKQKKKYIKNTSNIHPKPVSPVMREALIAKVWTLVEPVCEYEGIELIHIEYQQEPGGRILRLYIDRLNGVTLNDCADISRIAGDLLDMELEDIGPYSLEVSSPGLNRPLAKKTDFEKFKGKRAIIKTIQPLNGQKNFRGILSGVSGNMITLEVNEKTVIIPFQDIRKAQLIDVHGE